MPQLSLDFLVFLSENASHPYIRDANDECILNHGLCLLLTIWSEDMRYHYTHETTQPPYRSFCGRVAMLQATHHALLTTHSTDPESLSATALLFPPGSLRSPFSVLCQAYIRLRTALLFDIPFSYDDWRSVYVKIRTYYRAYMAHRINAFALHDSLDL